MRATDLTGRRFGRLYVERRGPGRIMAAGLTPTWVCQCDCGNVVEVVGKYLRRKETMSCGCYHRDRCRERRTTHGARLFGTLAPEYTAWCGMIDRCERKASKRYHQYGGRGIRVCERWRHSYETFLEDMGPKPPGTSIDRINNDGNYEPGNCRWATLAEQNRNKRSNIYVVLNGVRMVAIDAAKILGYKPRSIHAALARGLTIEQIAKRAEAWKAEKRRRERKERLAS